MAQIMVVEPDELVITALTKIFRGDDEVQLTFAENFAAAIESLNGNPKFKATYEKHKGVYEAAKAELQAATQKAVAAKATMDSTFEILAKYQSDLEAIMNPEADDKKAKTPTPAPKPEAAPAADAKPAEAVKETEEQKQNLIKEIARLNAEMKAHKEALTLATKLKTEKEKIEQEKLSIAEEAKANIPSENNEVYSVLVISSALLVPNVQHWVENFEKILTFPPNKEIKIIILGFEFDEKSVKKHLNPRISDYMIKPIDELLARQNIKFLALTDKKPQREVYSLQIKEPVDLVFEYTLESISELSFVIGSRDKFEVNEFKAFNCNLFLRKGQKSVLAKCLSSTEKTGGGFLSEFWFAGMDAHLAFQIKNVIKNAPKM